jgi:hypothetical protein
LRITAREGKGLKEAKPADYISDDQLVVITKEGTEGGQAT